MGFYIINKYGLPSKMSQYIEQLSVHRHIAQGINSFASEYGYTFMDDNAPVHRVTVVTKWKNDHNVLSLNWPPRSPDLNPIENIWGIMKRKFNQLNALKKFGIQSLFLLVKDFLKEWCDV